MWVKFLVTIQFATKVQLENLTHMFCFPFSSWKLYNKGGFSYDFTLMNMCHWG
jgi:hypothetical protein